MCKTEKESERIREQERDAPIKFNNLKRKAKNVIYIYIRVKIHYIFIV